MSDMNKTPAEKKGSPTLKLILCTLFLKNTRLTLSVAAGTTIEQAIAQSPLQGILPDPDLAAQGRDLESAGRFH